jgi:transposase InsO family protein
VRTKVRKKIARRARVPAQVATRPNERWSMDFVAARFHDGRWFRVLTLVDRFTGVSNGTKRQSNADAESQLIAEARCPS